MTTPIWDVNFAPSFTPKEMLEMGVFEGKYINGIKGIPAAWKKIPKVLGPKDTPDPTINYYGVKSRKPLSYWKEKGWIMTDRYGWFEWYIHYYLGRRLGDEDTKQINRWRSFVARHAGQISANCTLGDRKCRPVQRQGLLQWGWDSTTKWTVKQMESNLKRLGKDAKVSLEDFPPSVHW
jgi:hypothetical protein